VPSLDSSPGTYSTSGYILGQIPAGAVRYWSNILEFNTLYIVENKCEPYVLHRSPSISILAHAFSIVFHTLFFAPYPPYPTVDHSCYE
jgi:hypothetical protein